jgi:hypothetical protein
MPRHRPLPDSMAASGRGDPAGIPEASSRLLPGIPRVRTAKKNTQRSN